VIPRSVRLSESPSHGLSVLEYESKSAGAEGYRALAAEIIERRGAVGGDERGEKEKDPDAKPTVGFALPRVRDAEAAGCGAARLLELMNEERNGRDVPARSGGC